ncbi:chemotaxis response regulator protein-glutamate methylesterase CheB [Desulfocucumis palustris]|uniref:protein-glutamate methylesterase n=1 Tax=Desulfocucumis palustris TaxID=1898651 RepID=A0A2L2X7Y8_9FIRM|nr:chemotaxis protein CheB [Desulfocucumis palustris]GBF32102.1 chemotaxis response regulator protein-glutamate methylesterase CheB [Desulfocucumis palustris]
MEKIRLLILENSAFYKKLLGIAVEDTGLGQVEYIGNNMNLAAEIIKKGAVDIAILGIPFGDGIDALKTFQRMRPELAVVILGEAGAKGSADRKKVMELGGLDYIVKPPVNSAEKNLENIKNRLQGLFTQVIAKKYTTPGYVPGGGLPKAPPAPEQAAEMPVPRSKPPAAVDLILIASSTGGPGALEIVCSGLPGNLSVPVLIVQHMPSQLTRNMAQSLGKKCSLPVLEGENGTVITPGKIVIAPGDFHMTIVNSMLGGLIARQEKTPPVNGVRPAADVLFHSVAAACRNKGVLAVILTGMGADGTSGVRELKNKCDCYCITQSEKTCVVYGMPKNVVEAGLSDAVEDLGAIAGRIIQIMSGR